MKICSYCGQEVEETASFCDKCGAKLENEANAQEVCETVTGNTEVVENAYTAPADTDLHGALGTAIAGLVLSETGLIGWIISAISRRKCKNAIARGVTGGKLKAANVMSCIGLPISIICTFGWLIFFAFFVVVGLILGRSFLM